MGSYSTIYSVPNSTCHVFSVGILLIVDGKPAIYYCVYPVGVLLFLVKIFQCSHVQQVFLSYCLSETVKSAFLGYFSCYFEITKLCIE